MEQNFENPILESKKKPKNNKNIIWLILGILLALIILGVVVWKSGWMGGMQGKVSQMVPIPAARINDSFVMSGKLDRNFKALRFFYDSQEGQSQGKVSDLDIKKMAMDRLIEDSLITQLVKKYDVKLTQKDIDDEYKNVLADYNNESELVKEVKDLYDMNIVEFKEEVLKPSIMYDKLQKAYLMDNSINPDRKKLNDDAKKKAEDVLAQLKGGKDFAELAKAVSEDDSTKKQGGELGFFGKGEMEQEFEDVAFKLNKGETSDIVRTIDGFYIIKAEGKKGSGDNEQVQARQIFFKVDNDFDNWFLDQKKKATVKIYIKDIKWNKDQVSVDGLSQGDDTSAVDTNDVNIENVDVQSVK